MVSNTMHSKFKKNQFSNFLHEIDVTIMTFFAKLCGKISVQKSHGKVDKSIKTKPKPNKCLQVQIEAP